MDRDKMLNKSQELINITDDVFDIGVNIHIHIRELIPDYEEFDNINNNRWEELRDHIEKEYSWKSEYRFLWKSNSIKGTEETYCIYLTDGVTLTKSDNFDRIRLIYDSESNSKMVDELYALLKKARNEAKPNSIGVVQVSNNGSLYPKFCDYHSYTHNIIEYMPKEIQEFHQKLIAEIEETNNSGLYLLHGKPGTGKTSFLKQMVTQVDKNALFLPPSMTEHLTSPNLLQLLLDVPNSILIIEDAETVLMKRGPDNSDSVANLLNLTDGFPADFLNLNIICTFNTKLNDIDPALMREGRLKGMQEFGNISQEKGKQLAEDLGLDTKVTEPMTVAEICNQSILNKNISSNKVGFNQE